MAVSRGFGMNTSVPAMRTINKTKKNDTVADSTNGVEKYNSPNSGES